jgi:hypothetical protein
MKRHLIAIGLFFFIYAPIALLVAVGGGCFHGDNQEVSPQEVPSHFEIIFQNENEFGNLRVSTGTSFHSPDGALLVDAEGQAWAVEGVELADNTNVLVVLSNNNTTNNIYDDVVVGMYRVAQ